MKAKTLSLKKIELLMIAIGISNVLFTYFFLGIVGMGMNIVNIDSIFFAILHSILASGVLIYVFRLGEKTYIRRSESMAFITLLTIGIYNDCASCKYIIEYLYPGFIESNIVRFLGAVYVDIIIVVIAAIWEKRNRRNIVTVLNEKELPPRLFAKTIVVVVYALKLFNGYFYNIVFLTFSNGTLDDFINTLFCGICIAVIASDLKFSLRGIEAREVYSYFILVVVITCAALSAFLNGKRHELIIPLMYLISNIYIYRKMNFKVMRLIVACAPLLITAFSAVLFSVSGRFTSVSWLYIRDFVYRFDLSDFAVTLSLNASLYERSIISTLLQAAILSIPGMSTEQQQYITLMSAAGLSKIEDYNDTIFSVGAEVGGFVGMLLIPILLVIFLEWLDKLLKKEFGTYVLRTRNLLVFYYANAEMTWAIFFLYTRNAILAIMVGALILWLMTRRHRKHSPIKLEYNTLPDGIQSKMKDLYEAR